MVTMVHMTKLLDSMQIFLQCILGSRNHQQEEVYGKIIRGSRIAQVFHAYPTLNSSSPSSGTLATSVHLCITDCSHRLSSWVKVISEFFNSRNYAVRDARSYLYEGVVTSLPHEFDSLPAGFKYGHAISEASNTIAFDTGVNE
jgi:hypothetical protein